VVPQQETKVMALADPRFANSTTASYLMRTVNIEPPSKRLMPGQGTYRTYEQRITCGLDCDEVYPGIIIGTGETVRNLKYLQKIGVTHVLNTAENDVRVNPQKYKQAGFGYHGFCCPDLPQADISQFFDECVDFIDLALSFSMGKVFVSCLLGYSRSTAIVMAYLMKKKQMSASQALSLMRETREVKPNVGFLGQLGKLDDQLRADRYRPRPRQYC